MAAVFLEDQELLYRALILYFPTQNEHSLSSTIHTSLEPCGISSYLADATQRICRVLDQVVTTTGRRSWTDRAVPQAKERGHSGCNLLISFYGLADSRPKQELKRFSTDPNFVLHRAPDGMCGASGGHSCSTSTDPSSPVARPGLPPEGVCRMKCDSPLTGGRL